VLFWFSPSSLWRLA